MSKLSMQFNLILFAAIAFATFSQNVFGSDEAAKYLSPQVLFWMKYGFGSLAAILLAIKMYCSTSFADYMTKTKKDSEDTAMFLRSQPTATVVKSP